MTKYSQLQYVLMVRERILPLKHKETEPKLGVKNEIRTNAILEFYLFTDSMKFARITDSMCDSASVRR